MNETGRPRARILIADDQADVLESLRLLLKSEDYAIEAARSPSGVLAALRERRFDVLLMDLNYARDTTSGKEGLDLLSRIQRLDATLPVIVMTAWGSVDLAVRAMRGGARDFVEKPWDNARLLSILCTQVELGRALRRSQRLEAENRVLRADDVETRIVAESPAMCRVLEWIARVGPSDANVLITGENGAGKGLVARQLHAVSDRAAKTMVTVNAGGLPESIFESELFGHVKGAFTDARSDRVGRFELADEGTLFLDEIANITLAQQAKLLRVLETGELERVGSSLTRRVDTRVISATNANLDEEVTAGRFRQDLLFRLNAIEIRVPPLRERVEDIPVLAAEFLNERARHYRKGVSAFDAGAIRKLLDHAWPGNVRELEHAIERGVLLARDDTVRAADLAIDPIRDDAPRVENMSLDEVETFLVKKTMAKFDGNVSKAAAALGLSRSAMYRRLQRLGL